MFEPLPGIVRLRREQRNMTQAQLAEKAGVNRGQLIAFEKGEQNVTLQTLLKIARALEMRELPLAELYLGPSLPDLTMLVQAVDAVANARRAVTELAEVAVSATAHVDAASRAVQAMVDRFLESRDTDAGLLEAVQRLVERPAGDAALRGVAERPAAAPARAPGRAQPKSSPRRKAR